MIEYNVQLNQGVEAFGTGKSITANEVVKTCDSLELAREIAHLAEVVNERTAKYVIDNVLEAIVLKLSEGKAVVLTIDGKAAVRFRPDVKLKVGSINLAKAQSLDPTVTDLTLENAGDLAIKAGGVVVKVAVEVEQPLTDKLRAMGATIHRAGVIDKPYLARKENAGGGTNGGGNNGGGGNPDDGTLG